VRLAAHAVAVFLLSGRVAGAGGSDRDAGRQCIQRDRHDGAQQDLVALSADLALARERLRAAIRGPTSPWADDRITPGYITPRFDSFQK